MLAQKYRLRRSKDIARVYQRGRYSSGRDFTIKSLSNGYTETRIAIVVSRKVAKSAVVRNRIRRRISGQIEEAWKTVRPGYDIVITVREDISAIDTPILRDDLHKHLRRLELIKES
jgi:ribonuclease P protein component